LKNFGYVPKPGSSIIMYDWQRFVPTIVLTQHIPAPVLAQYLDNDTLVMLAPDAKGDVQMQRTLVGWQRAIPASVIQQYVPAEVLARYVPEGVVMATTGPTDSPLSKSAQHAKIASKDDKSSGSAAAAAAAAASSASSASLVTDSSVDPVVATAAAVQKPRSSLAGLLDDLRGSRSNEQQQPLPTTAYIVPVQQVQPTSTMQMQQPQHMVLVQPADGSPAYYMPVTAVQPATTPMQQQQFVATSMQQQQQQPVFLAPGNAAPVRQGPASGFAGSNSFQQGPTVAGSYPGYGPAVGARAGPTVVGAAGPSRDLQEALDRHNIYRSVPPH
jgi:hypothetical protein